MVKLPDLKIFRLVSDFAAEQGVEVYVIGGFVRDLVMQRPSKDIDIVVVGDGIDFAYKLCKKIKTNVFAYGQFGTAGFQFEDYKIEFVGSRKESYQPESRKPEVQCGTFADDQSRRDFTINAMAISLNKSNFGEFIDPFGGVEDIDNFSIRTPLDPGITFSDDPLRMLRAVRFACRFGFFIEEKTFEAIALNRLRINIISRERISEELNKILECERPSMGFELLDDCGLLELIFPELANLRGIDITHGLKHKENFYHSLQVVDNIATKSDKLYLRWAALLHDIGKPRTKKFVSEIGWTFHGHDAVGAGMIPEIFQTMRMPLNEKMKYVQKLVALHLRPIALVQDEVTDSAVRRLLFDAGDDIDDLMLLAEADITSKNEAKLKKFLTNFQIVRQKLKDIEEKDAVRNFQPPISGEEIMEFYNLAPGRIVGDLKSAIKDAILDGVISNNRKEAFDFLRVKGKELGLAENSTFVVD